MPESANVPALVLSFLLPLVGGTWLFWRAGRPLSFAVSRGLWMILYTVIPVMFVAFLAAGTKQFAGFNIFPIAPVVVLLFFAWVSTFRSAKSTEQPTEISEVDAQKIVQAYGATLEYNAPAPGCVADASKLPYPKQDIKQALILALRSTRDPKMREHLKVGYVLLADWQPGVGARDLGLNVSHLDMTEDTRKLAEQVLAQSQDHKKWAPIVTAEMRELESELRRMNLW